MTEPATFTADELRAALAYDPETGLLTWKTRRSQGTRAGAVAGTVSAKGYIRVWMKGANHAAHRLVWLMVYGEWPPALIDHINGDKADNRLANLRLADLSQNGANAKVRADNRSGIKGVHWSETKQRWVACIADGGRRRTIGHFTDKDAAAAAYAEAARETFGDFARLE